MKRALVFLLLLLNACAPYAGIQIDSNQGKEKCYQTVKDTVEFEYQYDFASLQFHRMRCEFGSHQGQLEGEGVTKTNESFYVHFWSAGGPGRHGGHNECLRIGDSLAHAESANYRTGERVEGVAACKWLG